MPKGGGTSAPPPASGLGSSPSELIDARIAELGDWRGDTLAQVRAIIKFLFNSSLDGNVRRAIDIHEGDDIDAGALEDLIRTAVALNASE